jgi:isocitrate dehydrogenase
MMTSALVSPDGCYEYEAAHGTVTRHYYRHLRGEQTSTNPMATLYAWTGALRKRAQLDGNEPLCEFAGRVERAALETIESGVMTGDVAHLSVRSPRIVNTSQFIDAIAERL